MRAARAMVVAAAVAALLAGCVSVPSSGVHGGQSAQRVVLDLELSGGVSDAAYTTTVTAQPGEGGLGASTAVDGELVVTLTEYSGLTDTKAAVDRLLRTAWSIGDQKPGTVGISIVGGIAENDLRWYLQMRKIYGPAAQAPSAGRISLGAKDATRLFGAWPGAKPKDDGRFTTLTSPTPPLPSPVRVGQVNGYSSDGGAEFRVSLERVSAGEAVYSGVVTASLIVGGETIDTAASDPDGDIFFTLHDDSVPASAIIRLAFAPADGFDTTGADVPISRSSS